MSDRIFGIFGILLSIGYVFSALAIEESFLSDAVGPKAFPIIIAAILGIASLAIVLRPDPEPAWPSLLRFAEIAAAALVMILYALFLPEVGFVIATAAASAYLTWRLGTAPLWAPVPGILTALAIYFIFKKVLQLSLASGPLDRYVDMVADPLLALFKAPFMLFSAGGIS